MGLLTERMSLSLERTTAAWRHHMHVRRAEDALCNATQKVLGVSHNTLPGHCHWHGMLRTLKHLGFCSTAQALPSQQ